MHWWSKKFILKWLRILHRDLGYFVVGITLVYAISGIILNHKKPKVDPAFKTITVDRTIGQSMTVSSFNDYFVANYPEYQLKKIIPGDSAYQLFLKGGLGTYNPETGALTFEFYKKRPLVYFFNKLHNNQKEHWTIPADFFAITLIFFAISGMFMVRGPKGLTGRGKWFIAAGIILVIAYLFV
jgi:hypothetical protein